MGLQTSKEIDTKALWKQSSFVNIYPVSKGTWSVRASSNGKTKNFTGLAFEEINGALLSAFSWLEDQLG